MNKAINNIIANTNKVSLALIVSIAARNKMIFRGDWIDVSKVLIMLYSISDRSEVNFVRISPLLFF
jgi:hypothetical protein